MYLSLRGLAVLLVVGIPLSASGQESVRLDDLLDAGLSNSHRIASLELSVRAAGSAADASGFLPDPMASLMVQPLPVYTARGAQRSVWRAEQQYTWRDARSAERDAAEWTQRAAEAAVVEAGHELRYRISTAYLAWYARSQERVAIEHYTGVLEEIEDAATLQYEVGAGPQQSILKAQIEKNRLRRRLVQLDVDVAGIVADLEQLVGIQLDHAVPMPPNMVSMPADSTALLADPTLNRLRAARAGLEAQAQLAGTKSRPDLTFSVQIVDVADTAFPPTASGADAVGLGVGLRLPVRPATYRARRQQKEYEAQAVAEMELDRARFLRAELDGALKEHSAIAASIEILEGTLIPQSQSALEATSLAYGNGRADFLDLLDAERTRFELEMDRIRARDQLMKTQAYLDRLMLRGPGTSR